MTNKIEIFLKQFIKTSLPDVRPGDTVRVHQKIREGGKERSQAFEGLIIARKHGKEAGGTITVRKIVSGVGVERIYPLHSPILEKIEIVRRGKARRAKLYYLRTAKGRKARLKEQELLKESR
ncbi:MAG: 50S ribosomal protein L19 [Candidatus Wildermuthbacteria bacterium RIFCSPHIGHO2_01_FULL_47_27]|uniref:Large ribosomal subunit protein bL19 n=2 Tax=Candidatus Wildermuthiibacteriota TaxID=1817923 RepID=A0A1G2RNS6_9BACT|nr:MAG: 50S ribosomal protein L19 [Parcubacteria group bacterium GW2011_GWA2_47_9]OHA64292.1 MAG: 50S ribosomal protein L19 [Candidatus Wildermuthbacteria bacterium RIFCSPHIGHO2_01_FULL_47_27]OHA67189.1 MAG: 50S ribosomal protein L19 [Candidatus Wildermuthbacteria bacterium RIFCSPHIGHO2_02_FULL_47_17]OHA74477.1 MAG: 50S ribosomal protein L19 [Candidatus Wildermuthbacteria bacterium RIFCSPLOWO2_01_FULL_48_35]OHA76703.1 MAG: 50S ribosomal protein L19 [Candidatus Wildermuthbacteria bacterium RIFCS